MSASDITRRGFLLGSAVAGAAAAAATTGCATVPAMQAAHGRRGGSGAFRMFVVSDAHFGWDHPVQPPNEHIQQAIDNILADHPDLDLFVDSGDLHHNNAPDSARRGWMRHLANRVGPVPMAYCGGNHDCIGWGGGVDSEVRAAQLANTPARPYYSLDIKGVHIVMLPQQLFMSYSPEESLEWLDLDLEAAAGRTTIIVSHNAILGTTRDHGDAGYRQLANSRAVMRVLDKHPHAVAWLHGHNHSYEAMSKDGRMFVSNGRIGGFDPIWNRERYGGDTLGGVLLEVREGEVSARGYAAIQRKYFPNFTDSGEEAEVLRMRTSLDPKAAPAVCWGVGRAAPGVRHEAFRHYLPAEGAPRAEVMRRASEHKHLNEDPRFEAYAQRISRTHRTKHLGGFAVEPSLQNVAREDTTWSWLNPGIVFNPVDRMRRIMAPRGDAQRHAYFRAHPRSHFAMEVRTWAEQPGTRLTLVAYLFDSTGKQLAQYRSEAYPLPGGANTVRVDFAFDPQDLPGIYGDPQSSVQCQVAPIAELEGIEAFVEVLWFSLDQRINGAATRLFSIDGGGVEFRAGDGGIDSGPAPADFAARSRNIVDIGGVDDEPQTLLVRESGVEWQVRNAVAHRVGRRIVVDSIRNPFSEGKVVVVAPMSRTTAPFVARAEGFDAFSIEPWADGEGLAMEPGIGGPGRFLVANIGADAVVEGGRAAGMVDGMLAVDAQAGRTVRVRRA